MDEHREHTDRRWDPERAETETERLDRNWAGLLAELRVAQTGVQVLTGFLLTLPFQQRFTVLAPSMRVTYLVTMGCSIASTIFLVAPVSTHRILFRRHRLSTLVRTSHRYAVAGLALLAVALSGVAVVVSSVVVGPAPAWIAGAATLAAMTTFWLARPLLGRAKTDD